MTRPEPRTYTAAQAAPMIPMGINQFYEAVKRGEIPGVLHIGRSIRVSRKVFDAWLDGGAEAA
jgi:hypothetical protein